MSPIRMTLLRQSGLSLGLLMALAGCTALPPASVQSNVPADRLTHETYRSPDGGYRVIVPQLNASGKVEEHQVGSDKHGVRFSDGSGKAYRVLRIDNTNSKFTLEQISNQSTVGESFIENRYQQSDLGTELRLVGLRKEGSPLVAHHMEGDERVARKLDLYRADSIFTHGIYLYEVSAGVTASPGQSEKALYGEAKRMLEPFLKGLSIK